MRDDQVFQSTRILGMVIVPFLLVAFVLLYCFPDDTASYFAWDVQPTITPLRSATHSGRRSGVCSRNHPTRLSTPTGSVSAVARRPGMASL